MTTLDLGVSAILAVATVANLILLFAVIRRLRTIEAGLPEPSAPPRPGTSITGFHVTDTNGGPVCDADLAGGPHLVAFVMPGCDPCHAVLSSLPADKRFGPARTLVFVVGEPGEAAMRPVLDLTGGFGRTAIVEPGGSVTVAFGGVDWFPTLLSVSDGRVVSSGRSLDDVAPAGLLSAAG